MIAAAIAHRLVRRMLSIKATPPAYTEIVTTMGELMGADFDERVTPHLAKTLDEVAKASGLRLKRERMTAARASMTRLQKALEKEGGRRMDEKTAGKLGRLLAGAYRLGQAEVSAELGADVVFSMPDQDVISGIHNSGLYWIGQHYGDSVSPRIRAEVLKIAEKGIGRREAGPLLAKALGDVAERSDSYWSGLSAVVATRSRSFGALREMSESGAVSYEYVNPDDERTSPICDRLNGTIFRLAGSLKLRDRLLKAEDPEAVKKITPWVKADEVKGKSSRQLQAMGVAWPPLHFRCRSSIDVHEWGDLPELTDPLGDVEVERPAPAAKPPPVKKPKKPKKPKAPKRATWAGTRREWKEAEKALDDAGLTANNWGLSRSTLEAVDGLSFAPTEALEGPGMRPRSTYTVMRKLWQQRQHKLTHDNMIPSRGLRALANDLRKHTPEVAARVEADLVAHEAFERAYRKAMRLAPQKVQIAERKKTLRRMLPRSVRGIPRAELVDGAEAALRHYPPDLLALMAREGENIANNTGRAYARPGLLLKPGTATANLRNVASPQAWVDDRSTLAHEVGHRLDGLLSGSDNAVTGHAWVARAGYEDLPAIWKQTYGEPFDALKSGGTLPLPRAETQSSYYWTGRWVRPYEGRIYKDGASKPTAAELLSNNAGPVEFIAMQHSYYGKLANGLHRSISRTRSPKAVGGSVTSFLQDSVIGNGKHWRMARSHYPDGYFAGFRKLTNDAQNDILGPLIESNAFDGDGDVYATALLWEGVFGVPHMDLLRGPLRKVLTVDPDEIGPWPGAIPRGIIPGAAKADATSAAAWIKTRQKKAAP